MRLVPFFNTSYVKSGFHLMTVASRAIAAFGAASNAFLMGSVVCAARLVETASAPNTNREISFMWPPVAMLQNFGSKTQGQYTIARVALFNLSADGQAA